MPEPVALQCLIIDDEAAIRKTLAWTLEAEGWQCTGFAEPKAALEAGRSRRFDLALLDLRLGLQSGMDVLPELLRAQPDLPVLMITAYGSIPSAVEAMRRGAQDYLAKPFTPDEVRLAVSQALLARAKTGRPAPALPVEAGLASAEETELAHIRAVLLRTRSLDQAARVLGMHPATLWRKRKKHKL